MKTLSVGDVFGEIEMLEEKPRETRAVALANVTCLVLNKTEFMDMFNIKDINILKKLETVVIPTKDELEYKVKNDIQHRLMTVILI